jgi:hypothetical protein
MDDKESELDVHLREFDKIKAEQQARIAFRDNLVYVTLVSYGAVISFAEKDNHTALLVLPWISIILGWNYLINDEKVSSIGRYVRLSLSERIATLIGGVKSEDILGWETAHRSDKRRKRRKIEQLIIDQFIFVISGLAALCAYWLLVPDATCTLRLVVLVEGLLLCALAIEIALYADLASGR